jgi:hypothetical protein
VPANRDQQTLDFDQQIDVEDVTVSNMSSRVYDQVVVRGARKTSTCTLGRVNHETVHELISDWGELDSEYTQAAGETTGYDALSSDDKKSRNDAFRQSERLYRVYCAFRLAPNWDKKSGDGASAERNWTFPVLSVNGSITGTEDISVSGLKLENLTRLKRGWDYSDASDPEDTTPEDTEGEYMPMFAIVRVATGSGEIPNKYQFVEKLNHAKFKQGSPVSSNVHTTYHVHVQESTPGIVLNSNNLPHTCALNHWTGAEPSAVEPEVDYETLRITCTIQADTYCENRYPENLNLPAGVPLQRLMIYAGNEYRLDFLAANTVVDLLNGEPVLTNGGRLRDDRDGLRDIARMAYEWYQAERHPITVQFKQLRNVFRLGMMITAIGTGATAEEINTVITQIVYDTENGRTMIRTNDEDLDLVKA